MSKQHEFAYDGTTVLDLGYTSTVGANALVIETPTAYIEICADILPGTELPPFSGLHPAQKVDAHSVRLTWTDAVGEVRPATRAVIPPFPHNLPLGGREAAAYIKASMAAEDNHRPRISVPEIPEDDGRSGRRRSSVVNEQRALVQLPGHSSYTLPRGRRNSVVSSISDRRDTSSYVEEKSVY